MTLLGAHWLALANVIMALFVALPLLAPLLLATGWTGPASLIYAVYSSVCHQWAFRSYFLLGPLPTYAVDDLRALVGAERVFNFVGSSELGYKVAFCERDLAIYLAVLSAGLLYAAQRARLGSIGLPTYLLLITPMALDGFTQLFGWRESTVELRTLTGVLFGLGSVWLIYPRLDTIARQFVAGQSPPGSPISRRSPAAALAFPGRQRSASGLPSNPPASVSS